MPTNTVSDSDTATKPDTRTDDELTARLAEIRATFDQIEDLNETASEQIDELTKLAAEHDEIKAEQETRAKDADKKAVVASLVERVRAAPKITSVKVPETSRPTSKPRSLALTASGREIDSSRELAEEILAKLKSFQGGRKTKGSERALVASIQLGSVPEERVLTADGSANWEKIQAVISPEALTAAGGLCAPVNSYYDQAVFSSAARPVKDGLVGFQATRGGIRFTPPPRLANIDAAITFWTATNDANPTNPVTKSCLEVTCDPEVEVQVAAVVRCLRFGNFSFRTFPEQVQAYVELAMAAQARKAEQQLIAGIAANSTAVVTQSVLGASRDVFAALDQASAGMRSRHRIDPSAYLRAIYPSWVRDLIRADIVRQAPGDGPDRMAVADATIAKYFKDRFVAPIWSLDSQTFGPQGAGGLANWPGSVDWYLFPEGSHLFIDNGELDLGLIRDSSLNETNQAEMFSETFETVAFVGVESLKISSLVCPSGAAKDLEESIACGS